MSAVIGSKLTTGERRIPVPTFRQSPLVVGNFENGYDEATTYIKSHLGRRFEEALLKLGALCATANFPQAQSITARRCNPVAQD